MRFLAGFLLLSAAVGSALPATVHADQDVVILGITSVEGDDELARNITGALRNVASRVPGWRVSPRDVSLAQVVLAMGCDDTPDVACLVEIARNLSAERLVIGTLRRRGSPPNHSFVASISTFDAEAGAVDAQTELVIEAGHSDLDDLREPVRRIVAALRGGPRTGSIVVRAPTDGADVSIDGERLGRITRGSFRVDVEPGRHTVRVTAEDQLLADQTVQVAAGTSVVVDTSRATPGEGATPLATGATNATPRPVDTSGGDLPGEFWIGVAATTIGAISLGVAVYSWVTLNDASNNPELIMFREQFPMPGVMGGVSDVCAFVDSTSPAGAQSSCSTARTWEPLQYVFVVAGLAGLVIGIPLMAGNLEPVRGHSEPSMSLRVAPMALPGGGGAVAFGRF